MTLHEYPEIEQGTDAWHDQRRGLVTASAVGRLITTRTLGALDYDCPSCEAAAHKPCVSKVKGAAGKPIKTVHSERSAVASERAVKVLEPADNDESRGLTALLVAERITGWTDPTYVTFDMQRGIDDEPRARDKYAEHYGVEVKETGFLLREEPTWKLGFSPDGLVGDDGLIEIKSRRPKTQVQTILDDRVPAANMAQIQAGLLVTGRKWLDYVSYAGGLRMYVKRVYPDPEWHEAIIAAAEQFESTAAQMVAAYEAATTGLAQTERVIELEMVI